MHIDGPWFKDEHGRTLILRGANLGGSTKVPYRPDGATYIREGFFDHRAVSFVGRPFPLDEADEHFARLRAWGMTFLRFLITWEAIEHAGPGQYDEEYLDYVYRVIEKAGEYGIDVFIDPHQDVWSRFTGGDGAPGWTLEAVGMDITRMSETGAAIVHPIHGDPFPRMIWPTNYDKLGAATMFTLFFAGNDLAPKTLIDGVPVQEYLQGHYIAAVKQLALRLRELPNVVGYDSLNEPGSGFVGVADLNSAHRGFLRAGASPTFWQAILAGAGYPQEVDFWELRLPRPRRTGRITLNPNGVSLWRDGCECIWKTNGVWSDEAGQPRLLKPDYFAQIAGSKIDFVRDYLKPFARRFITEIRSAHPEALLFVEGVPDGRHPDWGPDDPAGRRQRGALVRRADPLHEALQPVADDRYPHAPPLFRHARHPPLVRATARPGQTGSRRSYGQHPHGHRRVWHPVRPGRQEGVPDRRFLGACPGARRHLRRDGREPVELHDLELHCRQHKCPRRHVER